MDDYIHSMTWVWNNLSSLKVSWVFILPHFFTWTWVCFSSFQFPRGQTKANEWQIMTKSNWTWFLFSWIYHFQHLIITWILSNGIPNIHIIWYKELLWVIYVYHSKCLSTFCMPRGNEREKNRRVTVKMS